MNFIQRFLNAWRSASEYQYFEAAELPDFWTEEDGLAVSHFFATSTGLKLKKRLTNYVLKSAVEATSKLANLDYHCGHARGVASAVNAIEQHFAQPEMVSEDQAIPSFFENPIESNG